MRPRIVVGLVCGAVFLGCQASREPDSTDAVCGNPRSAQARGTGVAERIATDVLLPADVLPALLEAAQHRQQIAQSILSNHWSCYLPRVDLILFQDRNRLVPANAVESTAKPLHAVPPQFEDWCRTEPNLLDYEFIGVDVRADSDPPRIVVDSISGDGDALQRVVAWIRARAVQDR